jgi:hypothetical protein
MSIRITGNYFFVSPGQPAFMVSSNFTNYVELGRQGVTDYYLEGKIDDGEFVINASLPDPESEVVCQVVDNFPQKSGCQRHMTGNGYDIVSGTGELLLGIRIKDNICFLQGTIYDLDRNVVAEGTEDDFLVHRGPLTLGKSGGARGIVIE